MFYYRTKGVKGEKEQTKKQTLNHGEQTDDDQTGVGCGNGGDTGRG